MHQSFCCSGHLGTMLAVALPHPLCSVKTQCSRKGDRLPHVVCLKCDPNGVTCFIGKGPDRSEQPNRISKIHLQRAATASIENFNIHF